MIYYQNTNPNWIPLFKQFMESKGRNENYYDFDADDLFYYINDEGVIDATAHVDHFLIFKPSMMQKEIKINIPEGYEIDLENSNFECIKFKKKEELTYEKIIKELFSLPDGHAYFINNEGIVNKTSLTNAYPNNATSKKQLEKLLAINKLMNVAKYFNRDRKPFEDGKPCYAIEAANEYDGYEVGEYNFYQGCFAYFKYKDDCEQAIRILGNETLDLIFSTDW